MPDGRKQALRRPSRSDPAGIAPDAPFPVRQTATDEAGYTWEPEAAARDGVGYQRRD